jgi:hypothetical protein
VAGTSVAGDVAGRVVVEGGGVAESWQEIKISISRILILKTSFVI